MSNVYAIYDKIRDKKHFKLIFEEYYSSLYYYANKIIDNSIVSDDVVQEVFLDVWNNRENITLDSIASYLYKSVKFKCMNYIRHEKVKSQHSNLIRLDIEEQSKYDIDVVEQEMIREINVLINSMPEQRQKVFKLHVKGLKNGEIAQELNISITTVKTHKAKAREYLKSNIKDTLYILLLVHNYL